MAKNKLDPRTDKPKNKIEITKDFMADYMRLVASPEDIVWFKELVSKEENQKEYKNSLNGTTYKDIDIQKVRFEFANRFFPYLNKKKKEKLTFIDSIMNL